MMWFIYALLSAITAAFVAIFTKMGVRTIDPTVAAMIRAVVVTFFLIGMSFFVKKTGADLTSALSSFSYSKGLLVLILSGIAGGLSWFFYATALKYGTATRVVAIDKLSLLFTIFLSALFLGEVLTTRIIIGAVCILVGTLLITF